MAEGIGKITKIIYFIESPFNKRDYKRFGVETFIQDGFEVYVWDFTPFLHPQVDKSVIPPDHIEAKYLVRFGCNRDAIAAINRDRRNCFVISMVGYNSKSWGIFRTISKNKILYSVFISNAIPHSDSNKSRKNLFKKIKRLTPKKLINYFFTRIPPALFEISASTFALAGGAKSISKMPLIGCNTHTLWIHTLDYDIYLNDRKVDQKERNIAVFLDEYGPFHPDFIHQETSPPVTPDEYYPCLCNFFDYVEEKLGLKVVIAAHPRSHYEELPDFFQGRKLIRGKTVELVKDSRLVILHCSTSINFPVLYKKPIVFITTDELEMSIYGNYISKFASYFRKTPINISRNASIDLEKEFFIYEEGYAKYKHDFIKMDGTEDIPFWQVVSNRIKSLDV